MSIRKGWLHKYLAFTEENEAPPVYHLWSAITILGHVLGRRTWLDRGYFVTYPGQIITILVGPSGARKSTSVNLAADLLRDIPDVNIIANKLSAASFVDSLVRGMVVDPLTNLAKPADSTGFVAAPELSVFLPKQGYVEEIVPIITDIFDSKSGTWRHKTRGTGTIELSNPLVTILSASTPDWLETNIPQNAYGGGFMPRIFFVWSDKSKKLIPRPEQNPRLQRLRLELLAELMWVRENLTGQFSWTEDAKEWFDKFYETWNRQDDTGKNDYEKGYINRRPEHTLRVGMCFAVAQQKRLIIDADALQAAHESLLAIEKEMHKCFENRNVQAPMGKSYQIVLSTIAAGPKTKRELQRLLWRQLSAVELSMALQTFTDAGMIEMVPNGKTFNYQILGVGGGQI